MDSLEAKHNKLLEDKILLEQEIESLQILSISKGAENINLSSINTELTNSKNKLNTEVIGLSKQIELLTAKKLELETRNTELNNILRYYDKHDKELKMLEASVITEQETLKRLDIEKGTIGAQIDSLKEEYGKLKRLNDKYDGIESKLATSEMKESRILGLIKEAETKKQELIDHQKEIEKQKNEFISNPLSIGYYIKFLQKRLDEGKMTNIFDEIKRAS